MKKILYAAMGLAIVVASSCKKMTSESFEKPLIGGGSNLDTLVGTISVNTTVIKDTYLYGLVYVSPGVTLTINPGIKIHGSPYTGTPGTVFDSVNAFKNKGTLLIQTGAKIIANGTASQPIIWTSDNKIPVGSRKFGDWGGLVIYGNAPIHGATGLTNKRFEAFDIVPNDLRNFYGGTNAADNSGSVKYNRFEFGGGVVTEVNKEINGVTLCGVGNGTVFNHIEVLKSGDDAIEWFGGTVNCDHLLTYATKDDDFDMDEGYSGYIQFALGVRDTTADNSGSHLIEIDNDASASSFTPYTSPIISNMTLIGSSTAKNYCGSGCPSYFDGTILARRKASLRLVNSYIIGNAQPYGVVFTPTTGDPGSFAPLLDPPSAALPGNIQAYNVYQTNNAGFAGVAVSSTIEGNPVPLGLINNANIVNRMISAANSNNGLVNQSDFNLGGTLENTTSTPFYNNGINLASAGLPFFVGTTEKGAVITTDNWTLAGVVGGWISIVTQ